ncbi:MAG TPA: hypothetical protein VFA33_05825 [Bryobacteraceae bacterium]|nr:hypothetical protein [Bryobacteraceae bacterium]
MTPRAFLDLLWQYKPEEQYILIWTLQDKRSHWFQDLGKAAEFVAATTASMDVYVGVGLSKEDHGPTLRCRSEQVSGICGIGTDLDLKSEAHGNKPLPTTLVEALSILPKDLPPTIIIATGNGAHAWWLLKEPHTFETEQERADVACVLTRWHTMLRLKSAARGWVYDRLSDLARILRIPGTLNHKDPANPKNVIVHSKTERFYNLSDFEEYLDDAQVPDPEEEERAAREWKERFADKPIKIDLAASIPQEMLDTWMDPKKVDPQTAMKFRNTWNRQRHDLKDQSGSGYDLALACFGIDAGLSEQQIVDLIIHHRRLHKLRARTRLDYFQRTISKAEKRTGGAAAAVPASTPATTTGLAAPQAAPVAPEGREATANTTQPADAPAAPPAPSDPELQKAMLCKRISETLGIPVLRLVKITGKEPQYRMELADEQKIEFPNVNKLIAYESVRSAIAATLGRIIPKIKAKEWEALSQVMLDACIIANGTEETEWEGAARMYLHSYLAETNFIPSIEDVRLQDQRKPMVIDGEVTVCASDLQTYVNKTTFQNLSVKAVAGMLSAIGAVSIRVRGPKFKDQSRWVLPIAEFDPQEYPQTKGGEADAAVN